MREKEYSCFFGHQYKKLFNALYLYSLLKFPLLNNYCYSNFSTLKNQVTKAGSSNYPISEFPSFSELYTQADLIPSIRSTDISRNRSRIKNFLPFRNPDPTISQVPTPPIYQRS